METYANKVGKGVKMRKKLNILDILLERKDNSVSYTLKKEELSKLLFKKMKIDPKKVVKIDTAAFRTIHVELFPDVEPENFTDLPAFEIRDGLRSKVYRPHHRKDTLVTISWLDLETPDELISHVFSHFGSLKSNVQWCKIKQESEESEEAKLLNNILSGERQLWMELDKPLPSYASIDGRKVKIYHIGQKRTCARCQKDGENCPGRANAKHCEENGGTKNNVEVAWKEILMNIGYRDWNGGETTVEPSETNEAIDEKKESAEVDEVQPIEGCDGLVFDNLEENATLEEIKTILMNVCTEEDLVSCTLHPTGSLRSKILKDLNPSLAPSIAKKVDKKSHKGRMIYCKPFVPKTPEKEPNPSAKENIPAVGNEIQEKKDPASETIPKQVIPGLREEDRLKVKVKKTKEKKENKKSKLVKSKSIDQFDIETLTAKDFLKEKANPEDVLKEYNFDDADDESESDSSKEELQDINVFTTPLTFKSTFGRTVARSESRPRSRSVSIKRQLTDTEFTDTDEGNKKKKSLKSGIPTNRKIKAVKAAQKVSVSKTT